MNDLSDKALTKLVEFYEQYGYAAALLGALSENTALLGLLLPGGSLALLAAFLARTGQLEIVGVFFCVWLGTVLGYHCDYLVGRLLLVKALHRRLPRSVDRRWRLAARLRLARRWLQRHGGKAILLSHLVGHMRSLTAMSAGMLAMRYRRFLLWELLAAGLWSLLYCGLGYLLASEYALLSRLLQGSSWALLLLLLGFGMAWLTARSLSQGSRRGRRNRQVGSRPLAKTEQRLP
ncbi:DedA family protein [Thermogemmatispora sp.]|uniref:DedA family protein n=1 Tax=Thermogemmatispora sp. TaxID=1968838 RepID=UPI001DF8E4C7|nr:VTT domain-containing protein [Thermogemmatispora sp.]MBX5448542.1 VTT domain-containing protein [Thermogemmatispora sp.]